jgi:mono/diheme cytochrome c family protein
MTRLTKNPLAIALVACTQVSLAAPVPGVQKLYAAYCSVCHGESGDGNTHVKQGLKPPPRDFTVAGLGSQLNRGYMIDVVSNGKPGTAMVGWKDQLSSEEIEGLVDYIRTTFMVETPTERSGPGKSIYASTCSVCHGEDGAGARWGKTSLKPPPVNFTTVDPAQGLTRERMIASVTNGRPGTAMTAFASQLTGDEIEDVVDYIRDTFMTRHHSTASSPAATGASMAVLGKELHPAGISQAGAHGVDFSLPMPNELSGDAATGKAYYLQNCTACHGIEGKGDGPRAYFIFPKPRNFLAPANRARFNRPALFKGIKQGVRGREMPAWEKVLSEQQIADIAEYVFQTFIKPDASADTARQ